jgi:hypothetical protein
MVRCRRCGEELTAPVSVALGYGPDCARYLGLAPGDGLPQRCSCCWHSQLALCLLYGIIGPTRRLLRADGDDVWVCMASGVVVVPVEVHG